MLFRILSINIEDLMSLYLHLYVGGKSAILHKLVLELTHIKHLWLNYS